MTAASWIGTLRIEDAMTVPFEDGYFAGTWRGEKCPDFPQTMNPAHAISFVDDHSFVREIFVEAAHPTKVGSRSDVACEFNDYCAQILAP